MVVPQETSLHWRQRAWLALALVGAGTLLLMERAEDRRATTAAESQRLAGQAGTVEANLVRQLRATRAALLAQSADYQASDGPLTSEATARASRRLAEVAAVMPGVSALSWLDATGATLASNRPGGPGTDLPDVALVRDVSALLADGTLRLAPPFRAAPGLWSMNLSLLVPGPEGRARGQVVATLDPSYFETLLGSVRYAPDMWAAIAHGDGVGMVANPSALQVAGADLARSDSMFTRHVQAGQATSVLQGRVLVDGEHRLIAQRTVQPPDLQMDRPLVLAVSRSTEALHAAWRQRTDLLVAMGLLVALASVLALVTVQRRQHERRLQRQASQRERALAAERLELALAGAELALWDLDLVSGRCNVNSRWYTMLGEEPNGSLTTETAWSDRLHPDDRDRVVALQAAHEQGLSPNFQATYRLRHRLGHWVWVVDRGRVVERDASGRALRLVGTHMDISDHMRAEQALRENEESLATTLQCIGDAVIATDAQGRITRLNVAAERMTGWTLGEACGLPLHEVFRIHAAGTGQTLVDPVARVLALGQTVGLANDTVLVARDGREVQISDSAAPIRDAGGRITGVVLVFSDVTEHYRMVQMLRESEQTSRELLNALRSGVVVHTPDTRIVSANPSASRILGLSIEQLQGRQAVDPAWCFLEEDGSEMALSRFPVNQVIASGGPVSNLVVGLRRPDLAQPMWALCSAFPVLGSAGELKQVVVTFSDITERQDAQVALQASEVRLRMVSRMAKLGGWRLETPSRRLTLTPESAMLLGLPAGPAPDLDNWLQRVNVSDRDRLQQRLHACLAQGDAMDEEVGFQAGDGRLLQLRVLCEPVLNGAGQVMALQGAIQDLSEQHRAQQQLQLLQTSIEHLNDVVLITDATPIVDPGPRIVFVNTAFEKLTGWRREEVLGRSPRFLQGPLTDTAELARIRTALTAGDGVKAEVVNYGKDGRSYWIEMEIVPLMGGDGQISHFVAVQRDVTSRRLAQAQVLAAQQELAATLDAVPDLLFDVDLEGRVHGQHSPRADLLFAPPDSFLGRRLMDFLPAEALAVIEAALQEAHTQGRSHGLQYELPLPDGTHWFELSVSSKATPSGELPRFIALVRDITDRKHAETQRRDLEGQLREAQKMESIGTLAGGIAHDFNNILAAILGNVALAREDLPAGHEAQVSLDQIQKAGLRARSLVQQILAFSRSKPQQLEAQALQPVVEETLALLRATMPASVQLACHLPASPLRIEADATQLQQVLLNLCTNAWHALPQSRGHVEVGLALLPPGAAGVPPMPLPAPHGVVHWWVRDDGVGMDTATRQRIFDPFFTTKPVGKGTGLGLAVVHGIVRGHGGAISVDSEAGRGSTFHLYFPLASESTGPIDAPALRPDEQQGQGQHVLVVDDDEVLVVLAERLLQRAGFRVTVCSGADQALALMRQPQFAVDLVLTDFNMPGLTGLDLAEALQTLRPGLPVIISSGYITQDLSERAERLGVRALMKKENTLEELAGLVQRVLAVAG